MSVTSPLSAGPFRSFGRMVVTFEIDGRNRFLDKCVYVPVSRLRSKFLVLEPEKTILFSKLFILEAKLLLLVEPMIVTSRAPPLTGKCDRNKKAC